MDNMKQFEIGDDELDTVVGGYSVGDTVRVTSNPYKYCSGCGTLLMDYYATITGVRGVLDGHTVYYVKNNCCGHKTSLIETAIIG